MKTIKIFTIACLVSLLFTATTCDDAEYVECTIDNRSDDDVFYYYTNFENPKLEFSPEYIFGAHDKVSDTPWYDENNVPKGGKKIIKIQSDCYRKGYIVKILILKHSTIDKYTAEEIMNNNIVDALYRLTWEDLEEMNYNIVFTGE